MPRAGRATRSSPDRRPPRAAEGPQRLQHPEARGARPAAAPTSGRPGRRRARGRRIPGDAAGSTGPANTPSRSNSSRRRHRAAEPTTRRHRATIGVAARPSGARGRGLQRIVQDARAARKPRRRIRAAASSRASGSRSRRAQIRSRTAASAGVGAEAGSAARMRSTSNSAAAERAISAEPPGAPAPRRCAALHGWWQARAPAAHPGMIASTSAATTLDHVLAVVEHQQLLAHGEHLHHAGGQAARAGVGEPQRGGHRGHHRVRFRGLPARQPPRRPGSDRPRPPRRAGPAGSADPARSAERDHRRPRQHVR